MCRNAWSKFLLFLQCVNLKSVLQFLFQGIQLLNPFIEFSLLIHSIVKVFLCFLHFIIKRFGVPRLFLLQLNGMHNVGFVGYEFISSFKFFLKVLIYSLLPICLCVLESFLFLHVFTGFLLQSGYLIISECQFVIFNGVEQIVIFLHHIRELALQA